MYIDINADITLPVNLLALTGDTDFKSRELAITYDQAGMDLVFNFLTPGGVLTQTAVPPTTGGGDYDWTHVGKGIYEIGVPAAEGASINNDAPGMGWFEGICTGVLHWVSPVFYFRTAAMNDLLLESETANLDDAIKLIKGLAGVNMVLDDFSYDLNSKAKLGNAYLYATAGQTATHESGAGGPGLIAKIEGVALIAPDGNTAKLTRSVA